jgi:hypothetical protein
MRIEKRKKKGYRICFPFKGKRVYIGFAVQKIPGHHRLNMELDL